VQRKFNNHILLVSSKVEAAMWLAQLGF